MGLFVLPIGAYMRGLFELGPLSSSNTAKTVPRMSRLYDVRGILRTTANRTVRQVREVLPSDADPHCLAGLSHTLHVGDCSLLRLLH